MGPSTQTWTRTGPHWHWTQTQSTPHTNESCHWECCTCHEWNENEICWQSIFGNSAHSSLPFLIFLFSGTGMTIPIKTVFSFQRVYDFQMIVYMWMTNLKGCHVYTHFFDDGGREWPARPCWRQWQGQVARTLGAGSGRALEGVWYWRQQRTDRSWCSWLRLPNTPNHSVRHRAKSQCDPKCFTTQTCIVPCQRIHIHQDSFEVLPYINLCRPYIAAMSVICHH